VGEKGVKPKEDRAVQLNDMDHELEKCGRAVKLWCDWETDDSQMVTFKYMCAETETIGGTFVCLNVSEKGTEVDLRYAALLLRSRDRRFRAGTNADSKVTTVADADSSDSLV
jgi:hypothetical protein